MSALDNPDYQSVGVIAWACEGCHFLSIMILNSSIIKKNLCRVRWFNPVLWRPYPLSCGMMTMISPVLHQPSYCHACIEGVETRVREFLQKHVKWSIFITYHFNILHMFMNQILFFHIWYCFMCSMDCFQRDTCVNKCIPEEFSDTDIEKAFDASVTFFRCRAHLTASVPIKHISEQLYAVFAIHANTHNYMSLLCSSYTMPCHWLWSTLIQVNQIILTQIIISIISDQQWGTGDETFTLGQFHRKCKIHNLLQFMMNITLYI